MRASLALGLGVLAFVGIADANSDLTQAPVLKGHVTSGATAVALAEFNGGLVALVADEDDSAIHVFETKPPKEIAVAKVPGIPASVLVTKGGKVYVSLRDKGQVAILEPKGGDARQLIQKGSIETGGEPIALATTPDEATLIVTSGWSHEVMGYSLADRSLKFQTEVSREPRAIAVSSDGSKAFISHAVGGNLTTIDIGNGTASVIAPKATTTNNGRTRVATQGFAMVRSGNKIFVPTIMADPETPETYYGSGLEALNVVVVDESTGALSGTTMQVQSRGIEPCLLPRAAAVTHEGQRLLVGCVGDSDMVQLTASNAPMTGTVGTAQYGASPSAMAYDEGSKTLVVWSQMDRKLTVGGFGDNAAPVAHATAAGGPLMGAVANGRRLFNNVTGKTAADGRACGSCHTEGRDDGLVWHTPDGNRQTPMLAGRIAGTAPYGWTRDAKNFHDYVNGTINRLLGQGFTEPELADLEAYVLSLKPAPKVTVDPSLVEKGAKIFASNAGCATCHSGGATTDNVKHPVGSESIATPSLRFVAGTGPYFHDGRYRTLRELLTSADPDMGRARGFASSDVDALEAYVKSL
jgi:DNA-binding beta-propeller fold protein YncE